MTAINKELYDALLEAGASEQKASIAAAMVKLVDDLATRTDLQAEFNGLREEMYKLVGGQTIVLVLAMIGSKFWG
jgi:hypothetical protein